MPADPRSTAPSLGRLTAPAAWQTVDLISDLHLQSGEPATFAAWQDYMARTPADAVLILGDLFEVWVGDDAVAHDPFLQACASVLARSSHRLHVAFMPGNRDFLVGIDFLARCGVQPLMDPTLLAWGTQSTLLTHGDALCLDDTDYQSFRQQVRSAAWQHDFLAQPLEQRLRLAREMRAQSESQKSSNTLYADADPVMALHWIQVAGAHRLVHGHTHRAADHPLGAAGRHVLSDWSLDHPPHRAQVMRLDKSGGLRRLNLMNATGS